MTSRRFPIIAQTFPATPGTIERVLINEHSPWTWCRLANGDLILGTFPQDTGYFAIEKTVHEDYSKAVDDGSMQELTADE